ncbi:MAG: CdaR family protein [Terriglobia bacterium]
MGRWLLRVLLNNWWLKLLSLGLAYGLWVIVTQGPAVEIGFSVPLELRHLPEELQVAGDFPTRVYLELRGPADRLRRLAPEEIAVVVELSGTPAGNHWFPLEAKNVQVPAGIEVVRIIPEEVQLELVPR